MNVEKTFANDETLPDLPVPNLKDTLNRYLDSVKPHVTEDEFLTTKDIVENFEKNEGQILHQRLLDRAKNHRNWVRVEISRLEIIDQITYTINITNFLFF